jgi:ribosomal protein L17
MSTISEDQIKATIAHRNALHQQLIDQTLPAASNDVKAAVDKAQNLQKDIDALAIQAAKVPILQAELDKAHKAIWRDILIAGGVCFVLGLFGPKLLGLASMVGV